MTPMESGSTDARLALVASWFVAFVVVFQSVGSMLSQVTDELNPALRGVGLLGTLIATVVFLGAQRLVTLLRPAPAWLAWVALASAVGAFAVGAWITLSLAVGVVALVLPPRTAVMVVGLVSLPQATFLLAQDLHPLITVFYLMATLAVGLLLYVLTRLAVIVQELITAREGLARMKVEEERHRISRDLHDILGRSLVAVSLRLQTALRLLDRDPALCGEQLSEAARMVADGQEQLRSLTRGRQVVGLRQEIEAAADIFDRLGVTCEVTIPDDIVVDEILDSEGARIVRECVTNLLKHSRPTQVVLSLRQEAGANVLVVVNDGASASTTRVSGTGLADLADRVDAVGGSLEAGHAGAGTFQVLARLPRPGAVAGAQPLEPTTTPLRTST